MKLVNKGKYSGDESTLPQREHPEGYVPYREPQNMKKFAIVANGISLLIIAVFAVLAFLRSDFSFSSIINGDFSSLISIYAGILASLVFIYPHELLHALCFKGEVWLFSNLRNGVMFVVGTEDMSRGRFIFMSMLPNLVFGFIPYLIFMLNPGLGFFGALGAFAIGSGAGDYLNVFNTLVQVPKGGTVYMSGMHSYWYMPQTSADI